MPRLNCKHLTKFIFRSCLFRLAPLDIPSTITGCLQDLCNEIKYRCAVTACEAALKGDKNDVIVNKCTYKSVLEYD